MTPESSLSLGAVLFPAFEMLDYFGPLEMFSMLGTRRVEIHTVAEQQGPVAASINAEGAVGPRVLADCSFAHAPQYDLLLVPGGAGTRAEVQNPAMLEFLAAQAKDAKIVMSVCTGSALLAKAGVLDGRRATSNKQVFAMATQQSDKVEWAESARWVEDGKFFTSSGVSAGMDMSLAVIAKLWGENTATEAASYAEYTAQKDPDYDPFTAELNVMAKKLGMI